MVRALRVAFADFSAAPWQGFEKSERGPNSSSLFQPLAAVVVVAVQVLFRTEKEKPEHECVLVFLGAGMQSKSEPFPFDIPYFTTVCNGKISEQHLILFVNQMPTDLWFSP